MSAAVHPIPGKRYRFVVGSAEEAATQIRERLGESARVLSVRQVGGEGLARFLRAPRLEIIAEIPISTDEGPASPPSPAPAPSTRSDVAPAARSDVAPPVAARMTSDGTASLHRIWSMLERAGLRREFLACMSDRAEWQGLSAMPLHTALARAARLLRETASPRSVRLHRRVAFLGSPGAGATTALCKQLATDVFLRGNQACVMKLDGDGPNPTEGLAMFCEALGVPLLRSPAEMAEVCDDTVLYLDLPGALASRVGRDRVDGILRDLAIESRVLVVNAAYDRDLIQEAYSRAAVFEGTHVVFTHLDELSRWGKLWEFVLDGQLAPLFGGTGPNLAGDCEHDLLEVLVRRTLAAGAL